MRTRDTIFALSSGGTPSGVAVIRVSGVKALTIAKQMAGDFKNKRQMLLRSIRSRNGELIDKGLVLIFPGPGSFTGEDCVEFQLHGGRAVVALASSELEALGCRYAEAGEFTQRAFENGKLDLVEVEGLGDLISADTEMQRRLAAEQMAGDLSGRYHAWAKRLTHARAMIEAELDFADEEDIPGSVSDQIWPDLVSLRAEIAAQIQSNKLGQSIRDGFKVVISGPPNAGKSSFLNLMAGRDVAIVTEVAGTTRDIIEIDLDIDGFLIRLIDTAGIRETTDLVEQEGVRRARAALEAADMVLLMSEIDSDPEHTPEVMPPRVIRIGTKLDLKRPAHPERYDLLFSAKSGDGLDEIRAAILSAVKADWESISQMGAGRQRHINHLREASNFVEEALKGSDLVIRAEYLRLAAEALGRITGRVDVEDLLGVIFSEFCVGK
ncbi:tRNA uridine-5-carboxymethylaminomethyl(34) synthesis GTPase MnmE [Rhizobium helianthi]|uniref:tRNA modification GTPase MnmE n=1 Tax=Rhizobium helianthi TaxID=1132695 RepID=A0ABW4M8S9_9HYPH